MYSLQTSTTGAATVLTARGELDLYAAPELESALDIEGAALVVVDLRAVTFMDSTALGIITRTVRVRGGEERATAVVLPRGHARRIFEITGLDAALPVFPTVDEALAG